MRTKCPLSCLSVKWLHLQEWRNKKKKKLWAIKILLNPLVKKFHSARWRQHISVKRLQTENLDFFPLYCSYCVFYFPLQKQDKLKLFLELCIHDILQWAYSVCGLVWHLKPGQALLHSVSEYGWCSRPPPRGESAPLLSWLLWACLPLYVSVSCMTAEWGKKQGRWQIVNMPFYSLTARSCTGKVRSFTHTHCEAHWCCTTHLVTPDFWLWFCCYHWFPVKRQLRAN